MLNYVALLLVPGLLEVCPFWYAHFSIVVKYLLLTYQLAPHMVVHDCSLC